MNTLSICLILVIGPMSIDRTQLQTVVNVAESKLMEVPVQLRVKKIRTMKALRPLKYDVSKVNQQQVTMFWKYKDAIPKTRTCKRTHVILPPMITPDGVRYYGGAALKNFSVSNALSKSLIGEDKLEQSGLVMAHELGHQMCFSHQYGPLNLMSPAFPSDVRSEQVPVLEQTKEQMCL